ncbi:MAG: ATP-binding protein [Acidimicrobiales bacterium]
MVHPSGTVTFLFTDIEGSTRRWEFDPEAMRGALAAHDEVLRAVIALHGGWLFKHSGDGVCVAFSVAGDAVAAAIDAQLRLGLPVRMGIATGEAQEREGDYFGPVVNRAARVMAVGHAGQILVASSSAALVSSDMLVDLGERRLRDLAGREHLYQVRADGLRAEFPPLRTLDAVPGNLAVWSTSFVGRQAETKELIELVRAHRLVTLTGVGGVGKTRLAVEVAAELTAEFPDGVWLVELAAVGDPAAVADVVATTLGVTPLHGMSITASVAQALSARRVLLVLDNCEHVLDAAAGVVETILARSSAVRVLATSREGLRVGAEQLWAVPPLDVRDGAASAAAELFVERARSVNAGFVVSDAADARAVAEICDRLDGIALAIELAAARMVSMSPQDVRDRLGDRFRLLTGGRRGLERHQTLRHAVSWSYDLLDDDERALLNRCSVFAGGFDAAAAAALSDGPDEYGVLDRLDSLVRKSLLAVGQHGGRARYSVLETIRQYAEEQLAATTSVDQLRDRHAGYYAAQAISRWELWDGADQRAALDWVDVELANLRAGFRWATDRSQLVTAAAIAAHATMLGFALQRLEPVGWAEELLPAATDAGLAQSARLYAAASLCSYTGRADVGVAYVETAVRLEADAGADAFPHAWSRYWEAVACLYAGRAGRALTIAADLAAQTGPAHVYGRCGQTMLLVLLGRGEEAAAIAEETLAAARAHANPFFVAFALVDSGFACERDDPVRALDFYRQGLAYARDHRLPFWEAGIAVSAARLEANPATHGDLNRALTLYDSAIVSFHDAGNVTNVANTLLGLASLFDRLRQPETAAALHSAVTQLSPLRKTMGGSLPSRLRTSLGEAAYERWAAVGAAMGPTDAVHYAREQIELARQALEAEGPPPNSAR